MRAYVLNQPGPVASRPLALQERPSPSPGPGQIRIQVQACAACRTDLHVIEGELPPKRMPVVPGHQVVGVVDALGPDVTQLQPGQRVGVAWLHQSCGHCRFCLRGAENLCDHAKFTGYTEDGGLAEEMLAWADFVYPLPDALDPIAAAPLLCAGIIGYRALRRTGLSSFHGARLGIYGFGAAGHIAIQIARARGSEVYVSTRERVHQELALALGARWAGGTVDPPPVALDAAIVFAPAGDIVPHALSHLDKGGALVLGGIHMSDIPQLPYHLLYGERDVRTVTNNTREDGVAFLAEAAQVGVRTHHEIFAFDQTADALIALKHRGVRGAAVVQVRSPS